MPTGSCERHYYLPLLGSTDISCNRIHPQYDKVRDARVWYDITPLSSLPIFHRLNERDIKMFAPVKSDDGEEKMMEVVHQPGKLKYKHIYSANWFNFRTYYRGLPKTTRIFVDIAFYVIVFYLFWKYIVRPIIGPSGVLIHTDNLRSEGGFLGFENNLVRIFYKLVNKLKVPRTIRRKVAD